MIVHSHAVEDATRVIGLMTSIEERLKDAYEVLAATGVRIDHDALLRAISGLQDMRDEAHKVVLAAIDEKVV
jgi:hypothetical protein